MRLAPVLPALLLGLGLASCKPEVGAEANAVGCGEAPATLFQDGTILTMDPEQPRARTLLIRNGRQITVEI